MAGPGEIGAVSMHGSVRYTYYHPAWGRVGMVYQGVSECFSVLGHER